MPDISLLIIVLWKNQIISRNADEYMDIEKLRVEKIYLKINHSGKSNALNKI